MPELKKRMNAGYVLMDSYTSASGTTYYFLERGKLRCSLEIESDGHGWLYTSNDIRRI